MTPITEFTPETRAYWEKEALTNKDICLDYGWDFIGDNNEREETLTCVSLYSDIDWSQSDEYAQAEYEFETNSENAYLRKAEYDAEAQYEMDRFIH